MLKRTNFTDCSYEVTGFSSCWKPELSLESAGAQTENIIFKETGTQSQTMQSKVMQTDNLQVPSDSIEVDERKLVTFLRKICPLILAELDNINESFIFDGYELVDNSEKSIKKLFSLQATPMNAQTKLMINSMTWNSSGSVIALAYGHRKHEADRWCDHTGIVHLFNIDRRDFSPSCPSKILETVSCVTCIRAHPKEPSILAAGTLLGEVLVWNLQREQDYLLGNSDLVQGAHVDAISQLSWVYNSDAIQEQPVLVSAGYDGRILMWQVRSSPEIFTLMDSFVITFNSAARGISKAHSPFGITGSELGVVCFSFLRQDLSTFIVGIEGGGILRCSTLSSKLVEVSSHVTMKDPVLSSYKSHDGSVSDIQCTVDHPNIFLSCGTDKEIRIYNIHQVNPLKVILSRFDIVGLEWWPMESHLFAVWGMAGFVEFYNTRNGETVPSMKLSESKKCKPVTCICFNQQRPELLAVGDIQGKAVIWNVPGLMRN